MGLLVGTPLSNSVRTTYCGVLTFLDSQKGFDNTFGSNSLLLNSQPDSNNPASYLKRVRIYADRCMLDVFIEICRDDYVGAVDAGAERKQVHEICKTITELRQENMTRR